mgnify:CR=1 FL=1
MWKHIVVLLWICGLAVVLSAPILDAGGDPITIGVLHFEGFAYAPMMRHSYAIALQEINAAGGINGRPLRLVFADDRGRPEAGQSAVRKLVHESGAVMLVGGYSSSNTLDMARMAEKLDTPLLICTAADDRISQRGLKNVYRLNPPAGEYSEGLEKFFRRQINPGSIGILFLRRLRATKQHSHTGDAVRSGSKRRYLADRHRQWEVQAAAGLGTGATLTGRG